jgi:Rad3-related DNA helicase
MVPQREIIETVIKTLKRGGHAVLESPTGTGKTIALLCALLGYQLYLKQQSIETKIPVPVIYFATRTHSQIKQIIRELKKTPYRPSTVSLSGAARLCPYGKNLQEKERDNSRHHHLRCMCRNAVAATEKSRSSRFLAVSRMIKTQSLHAAYAFMKNERLKEVTVPHQSLPITECPYYATLDHLEYAEKIFKFLLPPISKEANSTISMTLNHGIWDIEDLVNTVF